MSSANPGLVGDYLAGQVGDHLAGKGNFLSHLSNGQGAKQVASQLKKTKVHLDLLRAIKFVSCLCKVKSAYGPSGPSGWSLSPFTKHEATRSISTPSWMGC